MAKYYDVAGASPGVKVVSQTQVVDVESVGIYTKPSSVYTIVLVPLQAFRAGNTNKYLEPPALLIEQLMGNDLGGGQTVETYVSAAQFVQAQDASGLLANFMDFTVYYDPDSGSGLPLTALVRIPMTSLASFDAFTQPIAGGTPSDLIKAAHARLVKLAGS